MVLFLDSFVYTDTFQICYTNIYWDEIFRTWGVVFISDQLQNIYGFCKSQIFFLTNNSSKKDYASENKTLLIVLLKNKICSFVAKEKSGHLSPKHGIVSREF